MDADFKERFTTGLIELIINAGMTVQPDGSRTAIVPSAEIIDTMVTFMGLILRDSEVTSTPTQTRKFTDEIARKLQRRINEAKAQPTPFQSIAVGVSN